MWSTQANICHPPSLDDNTLPDLSAATSESTIAWPRATSGWSEASPECSSLLPQTLLVVGCRRDPYLVLVVLMPDAAVNYGS